MKNLTVDAANQLILKKHHLTEDSKTNDILQISDDLCGLHATGTIEPYLTLFNRTENFSKEDLDRELYIEKNLGRIRGMRKTLFIETKKMIPIVHNLIKPLIDKRDQQYLEMREISIDEYNVISRQIIELLYDKEMCTTDIKKALSSQKDIVAVISVMCDKMLLIRGKPIKSWKDRRILYAPFDVYFPDIDLNKYNQEEAIQLLIQKYLKSYGPVTLKDITWWLRVNKGQATKVLNLIEDKIELIKISDLDLDYIICKEDMKILNQGNPQKKNIVNFLPRLDPYLMGYKERERYVDLKDFEFIYDRSGNATSTILSNGRVIGVWDVVDKPVPLLKLYLFKKIEEHIMTKINLEGNRIGKFITGQKIGIKNCKKMTPLTKRTMGGFMSPLKDCS
ncbi:MAG: winged helix DNA-binding domain-containing protein [Candidatus Lokiarchaeota archaeon]|nr:winged helix DNA-binding domain-containing protein [Candidatus Lokiarchaeota archaeon]